MNTDLFVTEFLASLQENGVDTAQGLYKTVAEYSDEDAHPLNHNPLWGVLRSGYYQEHYPQELEWLDEEVEKWKAGVDYNRDKRESAAAYGFQQLVDKIVVQIKASTAAKREVASQLAKPLPEPQRYEDFMAKDFGPEDWLFSGLVERGDRVILSGYRKRGKTTAFGYMLSAYCSGAPYLGHFAVDEENHCPLMYMNLEIPERKMKKYLDNIGVNPAARGIDLYVENLLGHNVDILTELHFEQIGNWLADRQICTLLIDPLRQLYRGDEDNNSLAMEVCSRVDTWRKEIDCLQTVMVAAHTGHENGQDWSDEAGHKFARPRGASYWSDWPDVLLSLTGDAKDNRFLSMKGRNGEMSARLLRLGPDGLELQDVGRKGAKAIDVQDEIVLCLNRAGGSLNVGGLKSKVTGRDNLIEGAIAELEKLGQVTKATFEGDKRQKLVTLTDSGKARAVVLQL